MVRDRHFILRFNTASGTVQNLIVKDANMLIDGFNVRSAMNKIVAQGIFITKDGPYTSRQSADCVTVDREEIEMT